MLTLGWPTQTSDLISTELRVLTWGMTRISENMIAASRGNLLIGWKNSDNIGRSILQVKTTGHCDNQQAKKGLLALNSIL